jgi:DNA adenine methylase
MYQIQLFDNKHVEQHHIVNVASVPQRSPFRYPGGKTWLVPYVRRWLSQYQQQPSMLIEPFAGGAIVSLTAAFEQLASHIIMVERDEEVAAVWNTILKDDGEWLADSIVNFHLTPETVKSLLNKAPLSHRDIAFRTILKNRVNHGGILAPGTGMLNAGENGRGIASRWYPQTLRRRILDIVKISERITFIEGDGMEIMRQRAHQKDAVFFLDPPYTAAGKRAGRRLYTYSELDHEELFRLAFSLQGDFLMTYDDAEGVRALAARFGLATRLVSMKNTHHAKMKELLISRNLDWVKE